MQKNLLLLVLFLSFTTFAQSECDSLFDTRELGLKTAVMAHDCYENFLLTTTSNRSSKANVQNKLSYLDFFIAEYFLEDKPPTLLKGIKLAEETILLFGEKYSLSDYRQLTTEELNILTTALYNYGLLTARYIDLRGTIEALSRMNDIKKSMNTILRLKEDSIAHYGAYRTMGIFHTKVPVIAGGDMNLAKEYLTKTLKLTEFKNGISTYPANNVAYADWLFKEGLKDESCLQLKLIMNLNETFIRSMNNGLFFESMIDVKKSAELYRSRQCTQ